MAKRREETEESEGPRFYLGGGPPTRRAREKRPFARAVCDECGWLSERVRLDEHGKDELDRLVAEHEATHGDPEVVQRIMEQMVAIEGAGGRLAELRLSRPVWEAIVTYSAGGEPSDLSDLGPEFAKLHSEAVKRRNELIERGREVWGKPGSTFLGVPISFDEGLIGYDLIASTPPPLDPIQRAAVDRAMSEGSVSPRGRE